jgi:GT2 family glycosyltransferase
MGSTEAVDYPLVSVVIVNYNSDDYLVNCVRSVMDSAYSNKQLIVVDNASGDGSVDKMLAAFPGVKVIRNRVNLGYAAAGNIGVASANGDFIVIMNPDTLVDTDWLEQLVNAASRYPRGAFFQPKILLMDDRRMLNSAGNMIHIAGFGVCRGLGTLDREEFQKESEVCYASGACALIRREALRDIGPMEDLFLAYGEDKDWGWRASMMGWQSIYVPSSKMLHRWSPTLGQTPSKFYLLEFERLLSICKNYSKRTLLLLMPVFLIVESWVLLHASITGWFPEKLQSYVDVFRARNLLLQRRRIVQKRRIISDRVLIREFVTTIEHPYLGPAANVLNKLTSAMQGLVVNSI